MKTQDIDNARIFRTEYLQAKEPELFDTVDHEFARRIGPRYEQSRAYNAAVYSAIAASMGGQKGVYCAGSISKGMLANAWVRGEEPFPVMLDDGVVIKARHVYDLDETIGSQNFTDKVIRQNRRIQLHKLSLINTLMPDELVLVPVALQGATSVVGQPNFDQGSKRRDKDYMQVWTPVIRELTNSIFVTGDWFFSGATSGLEYPEAVAVAAGLRKRRPNADMRFFDMNKKDVTLFDMSKRYAEYLIWAADSGDHYLKHEPTALMRNFAIATMAERGQLPKANPIFMQGISSTLSDMNHLQREMEPLILERVKARMFEIDVTDLADTNPKFVKNVQAVRAGKLEPQKPNVDTTVRRLAKAGIALHRFTDEEIGRGDFELKELEQQIKPDSYLAMTEREPIGRSMRATDMRGEASREHDGKSFMSRELLPLLTEREKLLASVVVGALETVKPSTSRRYYYIVADEYGAVTERIKAENGLAHADEVPGSLGEKFDLQVRMKNRLAIVKKQAEMRGRGQQVLSSLDFQKQVAVMAKSPEIAVAPGEAKMGSAARTMARHAFLARNVTDFTFMTGQWEQSNDGVQDMVLATRMQMGLQAGAAVEPQYVRVVDENGRYLTLADRTKAIWLPLKAALEKGRDAKDLEEPVTALAQLWGFHRIQSDHTMRTRVFDKLRESDGALILPRDLEWDRISPFLFAYDHKAHEQLWQQEIKPAMEASLIMVVRMRHLEHVDDFMAMHAKQQAHNRIVIAGAPENRSQRRRFGGAVPQ